MSTIKKAFSKSPKEILKSSAIFGAVAGIGFSLMFVKDGFDPVLLIGGLGMFALITFATAFFWFFFKGLYSLIYGAIEYSEAEKTKIAERRGEKEFYLYSEKIDALIKKFLPIINIPLYIIIAVIFPWYASPFRSYNVFESQDSPAIIMFIVASILGLMRFKASRIMSIILFFGGFIIIGFRIIGLTTSQYNVEPKIGMFLIIFFAFANSWVVYNKK
tara:strand:- start:146 stop:796 length:651 start_codon:yes stop_codon:yes gene_type:complete